MVRVTYDNGNKLKDDVDCDGCTRRLVGGKLGHEYGCPDSWRDYKKECWQCGCEFYSTLYKRQSRCRHCVDDKYFWGIRWSKK